MRHQVVGLVASPRVSRVCFTISTFTFYAYLSFVCFRLLSFAFCLMLHFTCCCPFVMFLLFILPFSFHPGILVAFASTFSLYILCGGDDDDDDRL